MENTGKIPTEVGFFLSFVWDFFILAETPDLLETFICRQLASMDQLKPYHQQKRSERVAQLVEMKTASAKGTKCLPQDSSEKTKELYTTLWEHGFSPRTVLYQQKSWRPQTDTSIYCKNLFLKDRKGEYFLVLCQEEAKINLKKLKSQLKAHRNFSFVSDFETQSLLGLNSGEITPFVVINNRKIYDTNFRLVIFQSLTSVDSILNFHPFDGRYAVRLTFAEFFKVISKSEFIQAQSCSFHIISDV